MILELTADDIICPATNFMDNSYDHTDEYESIWMPFDCFEDILPDNWRTL